MAYTTTAGANHKAGARVSFQFPPRAVCVIEDAKRYSGDRLRSDSDVLSEALRIFCLLVHEVIEGSIIFIVSRQDPSKRWGYHLYAPPRDYEPFARSRRELEACESDVKSERKTFALKGSDQQHIEQIRAMTDYQDRGEIVRIALTVLHEVLCVFSTGDDLVIRDVHDHERPFNPLRSVQRKPILVPYQADQAGSRKAELAPTS